MFTFSKNSQGLIFAEDSSKGRNAHYSKYPVILTVGSYGFPEDLAHHLDLLGLNASKLSKKSKALLEQEFSKLSDEMQSVTINPGRIDNLAELIHQVEALAKEVTKPCAFFSSNGDPDDDGYRNTFWDRQACAEDYPYLSVLAMHQEVLRSLEYSSDSPVGHWAKTAKAKANKVLTKAKEILQKAQKDLEACSDRSFVDATLAPLTARVAQAQENLNQLTGFDAGAYIQDAMSQAGLSEAYAALKEEPFFLAAKLEEFLKRST